MTTLNGSLSCYKQMDDVQFDHWTSFLEAQTGMHLPQERRSFLETSLGLRMKEIGIEDFSAYYQHLQSEKNGKKEWLTLVDRLTVHETCFFRHQPSLDVLEKVILPRLFDAEPDRKKLQIWSAGCSTGEEAYTLCMVINQFLQDFPHGKRSYIAVTGMDISVPALITARKAVYDHYKVRHVPKQYLERYFEQDDAGQEAGQEAEQENFRPGKGRYQIIDALKKRVCFVPFNIVDMKKTLLEPMEIIFCQNVLIYFNRDRRKQIIHQLVQRLKPGGFLVLGAGESLNNLHPDLEKIDFPNALAFSRKG